MGTALPTKKNPYPWGNWKEYCLDATKNLRHVKAGDVISHSHTGNIGVATQDIDRGHPFVQVLYTQQTGKGKGRARRTAWYALHAKRVGKGKELIRKKRRARIISTRPV